MGDGGAGTKSSGCIAEDLGGSVNNNVQLASCDKPVGAVEGTRRSETHSEKAPKAPGPKAPKPSTQTIYR